MHRLLQLVATLGCACLLLACSDTESGVDESAPATASDASNSGDAVDEEIDERSSATTSTAAATEPTLPPEASEHTEAGAEAFVYHFIDIMNYAQETGDVDAMAALSSVGCQVCSGILGTINEVYEGGGYIEGGGFSIVSVESLPPSYGSDFGFYVSLEYVEQTTYNGDGSVIEATSGEYTMAIFPAWYDFWGVNEIDVPQSS